MQILNFIFSQMFLRFNKTNAYKGYDPNRYTVTTMSIGLLGWIALVVYTCFKACRIDISILLSKNNYIYYIAAIGIFTAVNLLLKHQYNQTKYFEKMPEKYVLFYEQKRMISSVLVVLFLVLPFPLLALLRIISLK